MADTATTPTTPTGGTAMDDFMLQAMKTDLMESASRRRADVDLALARQRDATQIANTYFNGFVAQNLFSSDDPSRAMGFNTAATIPGTVAHPAYGQAIIPQAPNAPKAA